MLERNKERKKLKGEEGGICILGKPKLSLKMFPI